MTATKTPRRVARLAETVASRLRSAPASVAALAGPKATRRSAREAFFDSASTFTPMVGVESEYGSFVVSTADRRIGRSLFVKGRYSAGELPAALAVIDDLGHPDPRSGLLLDIGANVGSVAISALKLHGFARAVAIEPHPDNLRLLRANVVLNGFEADVRVLPVALSDQDGSGRLRTPNPTNSGSHRLQAAADAQKPGTIDVPLRSLDSLGEQGELALEDVSLAWMDVQGHEPRVLRGARRLLDAGIPMVVEFHPGLLRRQGDLDAMLNLAATHFDRFVDLRTPDSGARSTSALRDLVDELGTRFTDVLLLPRADPRG